MLILLVIFAAAISDRTANSKHEDPPASSKHHPAEPQRRSGIVQNIDQIYAGGGKVGYILYADGKKFILDLERDDMLLSPHFSTKYLGRLHPQHRLHRHCFYRGTVDSSPQSLAVFNLCGGLDGYFAVKHAHYTIKPLIKGTAGVGQVYRDGSERVLHVFIKDRFSFETVPSRASCETRGFGNHLHKHRNGSRRHHKEDHHRWGSPHKANQSLPSAGADPNLKETLLWQEGTTLKRRQRRSISKSRHVELLLVADESMSKKYGKDLHHYLLTLASIASRLYSHPSIENHIRLAVVKVVMVTDKEKGPEVSKNAATTLKNFCKWQHQHNQLDDEHDQHYDAAILFTREVSLVPV